MARAPRLGPTISRGGRYRVRMRVNTDPVILAVADALVAVGEDMLATVEPSVPDAAPFGQGLVTRGGVAGYVHGKRIDHNTDVKSPRHFRPNKNGMDVIVGFGFPARFQEAGTVHQPARPFLAPVGHAYGPRLGGMLHDGFRERDR